MRIIPFMGTQLDRLKTAPDRYAIQQGSGVGGLTTAQAAARQSVGKPTLRGVGRFSDSPLAEPRVYPW